MKDIDKEKFLFFAPQKILDATAENVANGTNIVDQKATEPSTNQEMQIEPSKPQQPESNIASIPALQILGNFGVPQGAGKMIGTPSTTPKSAHNELTNLFTPKQLISNPNSLLTTINQMTKPLLSNLSLQAVKPNIANPNPFGGLSLLGTQKNIPQPSLSTPSNEMSKFGESKVVDDSEKSTKSFFSGLKSTTSPSEGLMEQSKNSFRINKSHASSLGSKKDSSGGEKEEKSQEGTKSQKTGFKLTQKGIRGEEGLIPKKKVKLEIHNDQEEVEPLIGDQKEGAQKTPSSILRPSTLTK